MRGRHLITFKMQHLFSLVIWVKVSSIHHVTVFMSQHIKLCCSPSTEVIKNKRISKKSIKAVSHVHTSSSTLFSWYSPCCKANMSDWPIFLAHTCRSMYPQCIMCDLSWKLVWIWASCSPQHTPVAPATGFSHLQCRYWCHSHLKMQRLVSVCVIQSLFTALPTQNKASMETSVSHTVL